LRAISRAGAEIDAGLDVVPTPDDHLVAGPYGRVIGPGKWRARSASRYPTIAAGAVSATVAEIHAWQTKDPAPDDHFAAGPHRAVRVSGRGRVGGAGGHPVIRGRVVSAAGVAIVTRGVAAAPDNHFAAGPYGGMTGTTEYIVRDVSSHPTILNRVISAASV
jgi:hypothetical protein